jgi:hypothetical protein
MEFDRPFAAGLRGFLADSGKFAAKTEGKRWSQG